MREPHDGELSTRWSIGLLTHLHRFGVEHIVISPGSRSTPLVLAASSIPNIKKHVILDERSAAFFALGIGKSTGKPAVLICTSGTAAANYFPAVIEGYQSYAPLIVISADRPAKLQMRHAPQTINQAHLFGDYALLFRDSEEIRTLDGDSEDVYTLAKELYTTSAVQRGPVHLNAPFPKPLEPHPDALESLVEHTVIPSHSGYSIAINENQRILNQALEDVFERFKTSKRPVIIAGPSTVNDGVESMMLKVFKDHTNIPILAEGTSNLRFPNFGNKNIISNYETYLRSETLRNELKPDFILLVGLPPVSIAINRYITTHKEVEQWALSHARQIPDPDYTLNRFIQLPCLTQASIPKKSFFVEEKWTHQWENLEQKASQLPKEICSKSSTLTDAHVTQALLNSLKDGDNLFLSNSLSVRDADLIQIAHSQKVSVYHNRGASGIDGITSTAAGIATATGKKTWLLTGDLAFLHDTTALMTLNKLDGKLNIVILNNQGGTIFRMLPVYQLKDVYQTYFETPQQVDFGMICKGFGISHAKIEKIDDLEKHFSNPDYNNSVNVFECVTDADASLEIRLKLWQYFGK